MTVEIEMGNLSHYASLFPHQLGLGDVCFFKRRDVFQFLTMRFF